MLIGKQYNYTTIGRGLKGSFVEAYDNGEDPKDVMVFIMETTSTGRDESYGWLGNSPKMREWLGDRKLTKLNSFDYSLTNKDYEATLDVLKNDIEDDRLGNYKIRINDLATQARIHPRALFYEAIINGTTELCYDGQPFFSASHSDSEASGVQSNIYAGTGVTLALLKNDIEGVEVEMKSLLDDLGQPFDESEIKIGIVCNPALKQKFIELNTLSQIASTDNGMKGRISHIADSVRLSDPNDWYMANITPNGVKPIIRQVRQKPEFNSMEANSQNGFMRKIFYYGIDSREVFGYGLWQRMFKVTNA